MSKFYITTPIFYPNAELHMGHAYTTMLSDAIARYRRSLGEETYFLTGADENTEKVVRAAKVAGKDTKEYLDGIVLSFKNLFEGLEISYDQFVRTSDEKVHWPGAILLWNKLVEAGDLEKRSYEGLYCVGHEAFITEKDLVNGKCPDHGEAPERLREENWFFKLSKYTAQIKAKIENSEFQIIPASRRNEILAQLERGLEDISFSRPAEKMSVGIPVPSDPSQKMYVWCDALTNYISALGYGRDDSLFKKFWPADVQVIGKDILRFHAAIWPGMLISAGLPLPKKLLVHGFITSGGKKMSKSLGNVISPKQLIDEYGAEAVRYYLLRHISPFEDGDLTLEGFRATYNADLANGLGNLVSRVMKMAEVNKIELRIKNKEVREEGKEKYEEAIEKYDLKTAMDFVWEEIQSVDRRIQERQPFKLVKTEPEKAKEEIAFLLGEIYSIGELLRPFLPTTSEKILQIVKSGKMIETPLFPRKE